jgi:branched-chain amino acid transport system ATP-binding protein
MLELAGVDVHYGQIAAVRDVSLRVEPGEIVCLVGPNGAGKSTMTLAVTGILKLTRGTVRLAGQPIAGLMPEEIVRRGVALVPEGRHIFGGLTVGENLRLGMTVRDDRAAAAADLQMVLASFPVLKDRLGSSAGKLSGGEQQQLAIARALLMRPRIMLVDEPALGLAPMMIDKVYEVLQHLRTQGMTLLIIEQSTERALSVADRVYVMRNGRIVLAGASVDLKDGAAVEQAYFGFAEH